MRVAFISDAHVDGPEDPTQRLLVGCLDRLDVDRLFLLGDILHRGWSSARWGLFPSYSQVFEALDRLVARGVRVGWLGGNHDFALLDRLLLDRGIVPLAQGIVPVDGLRCFLCHGDLADSSLAYRLTRGTLRSASFRALLDRLGQERSWELLGRLAGPPHSHRQLKESLLLARRTLAREQLEKGAQLVILGHSHRSEQELGSGGAWVDLGAFDLDRRWLLLDGGSLSWVDARSGSEQRLFTFPSRGVSLSVSRG